MIKVKDIKSKRKSIALNSTQLFCEKGFHKLTVSEVAQNVNIAKGSIYKYFDSKEDIVFAIIENAQEEYDTHLLDNILHCSSIIEKLITLFDLCISTTPEGIQRRIIYKEFISICLDNPSQQMIEFQKKIKLKYTSWIKDILQEGIDKKILKNDALNTAELFFTMGEGLLLLSHFDTHYNGNMLKSHINTLYSLIKIQER